MFHSVQGCSPERGGDENLWALSWSCSRVSHCVSILLCLLQLSAFCMTWALHSRELLPILLSWRNSHLLQRWWGTRFARPVQPVALLRDGRGWFWRSWFSPSPVTLKPPFPSTATFPFLLPLSFTWTSLYSNLIKVKYKTWGQESSV